MTTDALTALWDRIARFLFGPRCIRCGKRHGRWRHAWIDQALCDFAHEHLSGEKLARWKAER